MTRLPWRYYIVIVVLFVANCFVAAIVVHTWLDYVVYILVLALLLTLWSVLLERRRKKQQRLRDLSSQLQDDRPRYRGGKQGYL